MFSWEDYLRVAHYLETSAPRSGAEEAAFRSAASRTCYSAYGLVRRWPSGSAAKMPFIPTGSGRDHSLLRRWLRDHGFGSQAQQLEVLHDWREQCDHDDVLAQAGRGLQGGV